MADPIPVPSGDTQAVSATLAVAGSPSVSDAPLVGAALPVLPCFPCPHRSACCAYGATVSEEEADAIIAAHGEGKVYRTRWGEWRTRIRGGRCVFFVDNTCAIHGRSYYPAVCQGFPWVDAETGGPYEYDQTICPEFATRPELTEIGRAVVSQVGR